MALPLRARLYVAPPSSVCQKLWHELMWPVKMSRRGWYLLPGDSCSAAPGDAQMLLLPSPAGPLARMKPRSRGPCHVSPRSVERHSLMPRGSGAVLVVCMSSTAR